MSADAAPGSGTPGSGRGLVVAIDGPAGAGKSTVAARIAEHFGLVNLETGAMYRAFALKAIENCASPDDAAALEKLAAETSIGLAPAEGGNRVSLDGVDVTRRIRDQDVTAAASRVSVHPAIRRWLVRMQRRLGEAGGVVMEGRDIGSVVFPDADVKIFLDAAAEVRGRRRFEQNSRQRGAAPEPVSFGSVIPDSVIPDSVIEDLRERDRRDRNRAESPLAPAPGAMILDSTDLTLDEVLARIEPVIEAAREAKLHSA